LIHGFVHRLYVAGSNPRFLTVCGSLLFFNAAGDLGGSELWASNGLLGELGEEPLFFSAPGDGLSPGVAAAGGFQSNKDGIGPSSFGAPGYPRHTTKRFAPPGEDSSRFAHDSSGAGTFMVQDIRVGPHGSDPSELACLSNASSLATSSVSTNFTIGSFFI
jgi:hypothetical protein